MVLSRRSASRTFPRVVSINHSELYALAAPRGTRQLHLDTSKDGPTEAMVVAQDARLLLGMEVQSNQTRDRQPVRDRDDRCEPLYRLPLYVPWPAVYMLGSLGLP